MRRGEVWLADLDPVPGSEAGKRRPAIVVHDDLANRTSPTATVVPLTTQTRRVFPFQVLIAVGEGGLPPASKAFCEQVRSLPRRPMVRCVGVVSDKRLAEIRAVPRP
jgi:mRNA interferase MazF